MSAASSIEEIEPSPKATPAKQVGPPNRPQGQGQVGDPSPSPAPIGPRRKRPRDKNRHVRLHPDIERPSDQDGPNEERLCYCRPNWFCCCRRCAKLENLVSSVGFFDGIFYMCLACVGAFVVLMWEHTGKFVESRGFSNERYHWWKEFMVPNGDGVYILMASYIVSSVAGWLLVLRYKSLTRCPGVWYMLSNTYATGLQITSMVMFPFPANIYNCISIGFRVYCYWVVWCWDRHLIYRHMHKPRDK